MGNIIATNTGEWKGDNPNSSSAVPITSFQKNINDLLLELDLYSLPKTGAPRSVNINGKTVYPGEVDYSASGLQSRPKNSAGQYVDVNNIPYTITNSTDPTKGETYNDNNNNASLNIDNNYQNTSKFYNFKRAFCNQAKDIPVNLLGVRLPSKDDVSAPSVALNNCIKYGTTTAGSGTLTIPDIDITRDTLNSTSTGLTNQTVYGQPLSSECVTLLTNKITNSYISADVLNYTKLGMITDSSITGGNIDLSSNVLVTDTNNNILITKDKGRATGTNNITNRAATLKGNYTGSVNQTFNTTNGNITNSQGVTSQQANASVDGNCKDFYDSAFCNYYYQHDYIDGLIFNPEFQSYQKANPNANFTNNVQYLSSHIPDCKCINNPVYRAGSSSSASSPIGSIGWQLNQAGTSLSAIEYSWSTNRCGLNTNGGQFGIQLPNTSSGSYTSSPLFNMAPGNTPVIGFAEQGDPININTNMAGNGGNILVYAANGRNNQVTFNQYVCNIQQINNISNVGGGVNIGSSSLQCNYAAGTPGGAPTVTPSITPGIAPGTSSNTNTNTVTVSINYQSNVLQNYTSAIDPFQELSVTLVWPTNSALPSNFYSQSNGIYIPNYGFGYTAAVGYNANTSTYILGKFSCTNGSGPGTASPQQCGGPIKLYTPFLYGATSTTNLDYSIYFMSVTNTNVLAPPPPPIIIKLNKYSMQINNVIPSKSALDVFTLNFGVTLNTTTTFPLPYAIVLIPVSNTTAPTVTYYGGNLFTDARNNNNTLTIGATGSATIGGPILPITYTFKIILNPIIQSNNGVNTYSYSALQNLPNGGSGYYSSDSYLMNYASSVSSNLSSPGSTVNFATLQSAFTALSVGFINSSYTTTQLPSGAVYNFGSILVINWTFINVDGYTNIDFYYTYPGSSPVKINSAPVLITAGTYQFVAPLFATATTISIYGQVSGSSTTSTIIKTNANYPISLTSTTAPTQLGLYTILPNQKFITENTVLPITINPVSNNSILDIISKSYNLYTAYNYTNNTFYTSSSTATASTVYTSNTNYIIFKNNQTILPTVTINLTDSNNNPIAANPTLQIGSSINVNWVLSSPGSIEYTMQLFLFGIIYTTITIPIGSTSGSIPISIYDNNGSITNQNTSIYLQSFGNMKSNSLPVNVSNPFVIYNKLLTDDKLSLSLSSSIPFLYVSANSGFPDLIQSLSVTTPSNNDNIFYNVFQGFSPSFSINSFINKIQAADFTQPILINYTASNQSGFENVSNVYDNIRKISKKREKFGNVKLIEGLSSNTININTLNFDLSNAKGYNNTVTFINQFNNYSVVNIQNLVLYFGLNQIDSNTFILNFVGSPLLNSNTAAANASTPVTVSITSVTLVGIMTTSVNIPNIIPGNPTVSYTPDLQNIFTLTNNNGVYSVLSSDKDAIASANYNASQPSQSQSQSDTQTPPTETQTELASAPVDDGSSLYVIIIGVIGILLIAILMWFLFMRKK
jgi:hypothetical protein